MTDSSQPRSGRNGERRFVFRPDFATTSDARRRNMSAIRGKDTQPEMLVRRLAHSMGYRYRLHARNLPGRPDMVFPGRRKIIEVRGCYWHRHPGCPLATSPSSHSEFWENKFKATVARDARNLAALEADGWQVLVVWECEIKDPHLRERLQAFLDRPEDAGAAKVCYPARQESTPT